MSINLSWEDNEHSLLRYDFVGNWNWSDLYKALAQGLKMEMLSVNRVDVLLDMRQSGPIGDGAIAHIRKIADRQPPNVGLMVVITPSKFLTALFQAAIRSYPDAATYIRLASSEAEARAIISASRSDDEGAVNPKALPTRKSPPVSVDKS